MAGIYNEHPGIVVSRKQSNLEATFDNMMAAEMVARETELYAAWRAGYDFLYVLSGFDMMEMELDFIPSDDPKKQFEGQRVERYDLREENLPPRAKEILMRFKR